MQKPLITKAPLQDQDAFHANTSPLSVHIRALRKCLIQMLVTLIGMVLLLLPWHKEIYTWFSTPLIENLPEQSHMIATSVTSTFVAPLQLILFISLLISLPVLMYVVWQFIRPALHSIEKRLILPLFLSSILLFYIGTTLAHQLVLPTALQFFIHISPEHVLPMTDIQSYLQFCLALFLVFGIVFEIPIVIFILTISHIITVEAWQKQRRFVLVGCFFIAMFITPPDALSMIILAVPMYLLFELGLFSAKIYLKKHNKALNHTESI